MPDFEIVNLIDVSGGFRIERNGNLVLIVFDAKEPYAATLLEEQLCELIDNDEPIVIVQS